MSIRPAAAIMRKKAFKLASLRLIVDRLRPLAASVFRKSMISLKETAATLSGVMWPQPKNSRRSAE